MISISSAFDGGNIIVANQDDPHHLLLRIRNDHQSNFYQWFYFRLQGAKQQACCMRIVNAAGAAYPGGWDDYRAVASYDRQHWFRVPTRYQDGELVIEHKPDQDLVYYAYFAPYSWERHQDLITRALDSPRCRYESLGQSLDGHELDLLIVGQQAPHSAQNQDRAQHLAQNQAQKKRVWITARQHPGETMGGWFMEGLLERLLDEQDPIAQALLDQAVFYLVPNINPDGAIRGHLRTNAIGVNLNREWAAPSMARSPEVCQTLTRMDEVGVDLYLDIHGDETLPYNFLAGCAGNPNFSDRQRRLEAAFREAFLHASPDYQTEYGYADDEFGDQTLTIAGNQIGYRFGCLALTLEMPFKDNANRKDPQQGWSPERSAKLGEAILQPILRVLGSLR